MNLKKWLTVTSRGSARITQTKPSVSADEISILLDLRIPDSLFNRPRLEAKIELPEVAADVLEAHVIENVKDIIEESTGLTFAINVIKEEKDDE